MVDTPSKPNTDDVLDKAADYLWIYSWLAAFLWVLGIVGYQSVHWLRFGEWKAIPFISAFKYFGLDLNFIYDPQSWIGAARFAQWILSLPLSLVGALLIVISAGAIRNMVRGNL